MKRRVKAVRKSKVSFLLALVLMLSLMIAPVTQAMEDQTIDLDELLVADENHVINYNELRTDIIQKLSEAELQRLKDEIVSDYINRNPDAVLEIPLTDAQMQKATKQKESNIGELISRKQIQLDKQSKVESLNIGTNKTFSTSQIFTRANAGFSIASDISNRTKANFGTDGTGWADAKSDCQCPGGIGSGYAISSIGLVVPVTGSGSSKALVNIQGIYNGYMQVAGMTSGNLNTHAYTSVDVDIYEVNPSTGQLVSLVATSNIYSNGYVLSVLPNSFGGDISETLMPTLYAGKTYYFAITAYTESEMAWYDVFTWATADMYDDSANGASGGEGVDFTSVEVTLLYQ